jgi:hypothetical protein
MTHFQQNFATNGQISSLLFSNFSVCVWSDAYDQGIVMDALG